LVLDVGKSLAYHGFKKIVLVNGHGSNAPNLDLASRRINLETDAECVYCKLFPRRMRSCLRVGDLGLFVFG
jgi:creatinine amidohydrolase/Fe(II)-dependent formamide hydrolase-like protein